jgi:hypothetical protein
MSDVCQFPVREFPECGPSRLAMILLTALAHRAKASSSVTWNSHCLWVAVISKWWV